MRKLVRKDRGDDVLALQRALVGLGYPLPRFGEDGIVGNEVFAAASEYAQDRGLEDPELAEAISPALQMAILEELAASGRIQPDTYPVVIEDVCDRHAGTRRVARRPWAAVTGITLHQTACLLGETWERWSRVALRFGATREGRAFYLNGMDYVVHQAQAFNANDVGIEVDGYYAGVAARPETLWRPESDPDRQPMAPTERQVLAVQAIIRFVVDTVAAHGGNVRHIHAHRQTSKDRRSCPGELIWRACGLWAQNTLGLSDGGRGYTVHNGRPIPVEWDDRYSGLAY